MQGMRVWSLVREQRSHMWWGNKPTHNYWAREPQLREAPKPQQSSRVPQRLDADKTLKK